MTIDLKSLKKLSDPENHVVTRDDLKAALSRAVDRIDYLEALNTTAENSLDEITSIASKQLEMLNGLTGKNRREKVAKPPSHWKLK